MIATRRWVIAAMIALLWSVTGLAQSPAVQTVRFSVFASKSGASLSIVPRAGAAPQKLTFFPTARSMRVEYRGTMPIRFTDSDSGALVAEATVPPEMREALLLFTPVEPAPEKGLRYQVSVLDDGVRTLAAGGLTILNLSGLSLSGTVAGRAVTLEAGLNPTIPVNRSAKVVLRTTVKQRSQQSYAETVQLTRGQRALLILFPPFYKGSLEVQPRLLIDDVVGGPGPRTKKGS